MPKTKAFKELLVNLRENYLGKEVPLPYQKRYGKRYDPKDIKQFGYALAKSRGIKTDLRK
jgi:hypothetical protein